MKNSFLWFLLLFMATSSIFSQIKIDRIVTNHFDIKQKSSVLQKADVQEWKVTDIVPSLNPEIQHVYVQQYHQGIPIQFATYKLTVKGDAVTFEINQFIDNMSSKIESSSASISAESAINTVASVHKLQTPQLSNVTTKSQISKVYDNTGVSLEPIKAEQVFYNDDGKLKLTWRVSIYEASGDHWWNVNVDASNGKILYTEDWVITCNFGTPDHLDHNHSKPLFGPENEPNYLAETSANAMMDGSYNVYPIPIESPNHGNRSIVTNPADATASPFGWHDTNGSNGAEFTITRGNNVWAQDDSNGNNGTGFSPNGGSGLNFDYPINFNNQPSSYISASITNLFYWNNVIHDIFYQYGFNEASGNFQENNYGRGGLGSDSVNADAQDGSGTNNANFATPADGSNPRMQMFLFTNPTRDGDLDNVIITHEYGHGISTRLVGGPSSNVLGGSEQMGEGWSDWFGLMLTMKPGDVGTTGRGVGTFAVGEDTNGGGIRPTPYSTNRSINNTEYADIGGLSIPHGVGYGFATILWDLTWELIALEGFDSNLYNGTGGNNIAMALVVEGLKNTANNPGFVSGRDGILQADQDLYGGQYNCNIWKVFSERGVGLGASENNNGGTNTNSDQTVSFVNACNVNEDCSGNVASFPYAESFEGSIGAWTQSNLDDLDWTVNSGGTPSSGTGPAGAIDGNSYIYVEASGDGAGFPNKQAILNSPCLDLSSLASATLDFQYHMIGNAVGSLNVEARANNNGSWVSIFNRNGAQGTDWNTANVDLSSYVGESSVQLRLNVVTGSSWQGDITIDGLNITGVEAGGNEDCTGSVSSFPYDESFEGSVGAWSQNSGDDLDWTVNSGGTPSNGTGPTGAVDGSSYIYVEASGDGVGYPNKQAILNSPCLDLSGQSNLTLSFQYHMIGNAVGTLNIEARTNNTGDWVSIFNRSGDQGADWNIAEIDLGAYEGQSSVQLRLNVVTGSSWQGDISIDALNISSPVVNNGCVGGVSAYPFNESFEGSSFPGFSNAAGNDVNWTLNSGGTPSSGTGPSGAGDGSTYAFVETSGNNTGYPNKVAILNAPCFDLSNVSSATFSFQYHMLGNAVGSLTVEASDDNGVTWVAVFARSGSQGSAWRTANVNLSDYVGGSVQFRFNVLTANSWQGDIAVDDIGVTTGSSSSFAGNNDDVLDGADAFSVSLFPNPVKSGNQLQVAIKGTSNAPSSFTIVNLLGQTVSNGKLSDGNNTLDVSSLQAGVYMLNINSEAGKVLKRFIVE